MFLKWLELIGITLNQLAFRITIHETADIAVATTFWAAVAGVPPAHFQKPTIKRHRPGTNRRNVGDDYHGCLVIRVRRSTDLGRQIAGWWQGITRATDSLSA